MTILDWGTTADHNGSQSDTNTRHEQPTGTDWAPSDTVQFGYSSALNNIGPLLLAYYPLAESSGTTAHDVAGSYDGTLTGGTQAQTGPWGANSTYFDGTDDYVDCGTNLANLTSSFACCAWVNLGRTSWNENWENFLTNDYAGYGNFAIQRKGQTSYVSTVVGGANRWDMVADSNILDSDWHFVYGHYDNSAGEAFLRIDDATDTRSVTYDFDSQPGNTHLASQGGGNSPGQAQLAHVMFWAGTLSTAEQDVLRNWPTDGGEHISSAQVS